MANNDEIVIWMNGKKTTIERGKGTMRSEESITKAEHAATVDKHLYQNADKLELPGKNNQTGHQQHPPKKRRYNWKPVIIAIISAVCIGGLFGLVMLKVVGTLDDYGAPQSNASSISDNINDGDKTSSKNDSQGESDYQLPEIKSFVIQGGVFEEKASVKEWKESFQDAAFSPVIWPKEDNYYLFVGIAPAKEQANDIVKEINETYGLDVFAKEWKTAGRDLALSEDEQQWISSAVELWNDSLENIHDESGLPVDDWKKLIENSPDQKSDISSFIEELTERVSKLDKPSEQEASGFLMHIWYLMDHLQEK